MDTEHSGPLRTLVQRSIESAAAPSGPWPAAAVRGLRSPSELIEPVARAAVERRLGFDFSQVRIHRGAEAATSARALGARAYTVGGDIVFGTGQYRPGSPAGLRLLTHELVHVVQQSGSPSAVVARSATRAVGQDSGTGDEEVTRCEVLHRTAGPMLQGDFALPVPRPDAVGRALSQAEMAAALAFDRRVLDPAGADVIRELRDVLGISAEPAVVDEDLVNAVVRWQAAQGLTQDGKLGPRSARPLFREIGAEGAGHCEIKSGPSYSPSGTLAVTVAGARKSATFAMRAEFESDPANGVFPSCCEIRQFIQWDATAAASFPTGVPHAGFPAATPAGRWIEDRDDANTRYGYRSGPFSAPAVGDEYLDSTRRRNQAFGHRYRGRDTPSRPVARLGTYRFLIRVVDVCNGNARVGGQDFVRINW